jgi:putative FmdB family regulatory protein
MAGGPLSGACYNSSFAVCAGGQPVPLYEYECTKCHKKTEKIEGVSGPHLRKCPHCGGRVERLQSAPAIQFKGAGWYVTDYASKKPSSGDSAPADKDSPKETPKEAPKETSKEGPKEPVPTKESKEKKLSKK